MSVWPCLSPSRLDVDCRLTLSLHLGPTTNLTTISNVLAVASYRLETP